MERSATEAATKPADPTRKLPALDIVADDFSVRQLRFGRLELRASNDGGVWNLRRISTSNPHGTFTGQGTWQRSGGPGRTQLDFRMDSSDVGELLGRLGYPGTVRAGAARLDGKLAWNGGPTDIDFASLNGDLGLEASKGQFLKLDPGAAGKLLGLISLQNLPRRITLDFKDVFSAGFAFDSIAGKMAVQKGVMRTDQLEIAGPAARVVMRGEVDLKRETQRLNVNVLPEVGDTAALGVAIVNPAAGAATWLASKLLKNPLGNVFGYAYRITGTWDDPKVEKLSSAAATSDGNPKSAGNASTSWRSCTMNPNDETVFPDLKNARVAAIQMISTTRVEENLRTAGTLIAEAVAQGAQLVALPEYFPIMGRRDADKIAAREVDGNGPIQDFLAETACKHGVWVVGGSLPLVASVDDKVLNTCLVFNPQVRGWPATTRSTCSASRRARSVTTKARRSNPVASR